MMSSSLILVLTLLCSSCTRSVDSVVTTAPQRTHIVAILADDFGWADAGWHAKHGVVTPQMNSLVQSGIELNRNYVHKYCSPTRSAIQSGRHPMHVNVMNLNPNFYNPEDPVSGFSAIPRNMTGLAEMMKRGNYRTVFAGKWDAGMATMDHTPRGRGYDESLHYFHHMNDYWMEYYVGNVGPAGGGGSKDIRCSPDVRSYPTGLPAPIDLWHAPSGQPEGPAIGLNGSAGCVPVSAAAKKMPAFPEINTCPEDDDGSSCPPYPGWPGEQTDGCKYEDALFLDFVLDAINQHDLEGSKPLFLFWSPHIAHTPLQVPKVYLDKFSNVHDWRRRRYLAMVNYLDDGIGRVVEALESKGMMNDTLITFSADNGGPVYGNGTSGGNNFPLKGGKASNWEGGIRVNAFVSGGALPNVMRGTKNHAIVTPWDWWRTFADVAGIQDVEDHKAAAAGLPPVDGVSQWPLWKGETTSPPRTELAVAGCQANDGSFDLWCVTPGEITIVGGVIVDEGPIHGMWKLLKEPAISMSSWQGPDWPNATTTHFSEYMDKDCGGELGCLYRIDLDPTEHENVVHDPLNGERVVRMTKLLKKMNGTTFSPNRGTADFELSCRAVHEKWSGFWGPFVE